MSSSKRKKMKDYKHSKNDISYFMQTSGTRRTLSEIIL